MAENKSTTGTVTNAAVVETAAPALPVEPDLQAGPGQKVVTSPTGTKTVVLESAVEALKAQGYKV
jgi:hypothetical protein